MENFTVNRTDKEDISVLYIGGFLDAHTAPDLENAIQNLIDGERYKIIVNFNDLTYISSAGLGVFMGYIELIRNNDGDIKMSNMSPKIFRVFDLLGFPTLYDIVDDEIKALENFK
ncbi:STAS domain-containing protein [candidate division KSB1 bacterium]|nr:STAS domain-containing protein [candidate division KSB1 bacterium]